MSAKLASGSAALALVLFLVYLFTLHSAVSTLAAFVGQVPDLPAVISRLRGWAGRGPAPRS